MRIVMKSMCVLITVILLSFTLYGQEVLVSKEVKGAFEKLYPKASDVKWEKEKKGEFEAGFKDDGKNISVVFDNDGNLKETETSIPVTELPKPIAPYIEKKHEGFNITGAFKIIDNKGKVTYEAEIKKDKETKELKFDQDGKHISKKEMKNEKNEKEEKEKE
jgi:hypothetical protein